MGRMLKVVEELRNNIRLTEFWQGPICVAIIESKFQRLNAVDT